jgi:hypothetical protein
MTRAQRLKALAEEHDAWVGENLAHASGTFDSAGRRAGSDYNLHHVDVDASGEAQDDFCQRVSRLFETG